MSIPSWQLEDKSNSGQKDNLNSGHKEDNFVENGKTALKQLSCRSETFEDETTGRISKSSKRGRNGETTLNSNGLNSSPDIVSQE